jgi:hypothetical protein
MRFRVKVWKEETCVRCGTRYRHSCIRGATGRGSTPEDAEADAHARVLALAKKHVGQRPCPGCGTYQPDMVADRRWRRHLYIMLAEWAVGAALYALFAMYLSMLGVSSLFLAAACVVGLAAHIANDRLGANARPSVNLRRARLLMAAEEMELVEGSGPVQVHRRQTVRGWGLAYCVGYLLLLVGLGAILLPESVRLAAGWPANPGWSPEVVGPGDGARTELPDTIYPLNGKWQGKARVEVLNAEELGLAPGTELTASSNHDTWGNLMYVEKDKGEHRTKLWARMEAPPDEALVGRTLHLRITLDAAYPHSQGKQFVTRTQTFQHTAELTLAPVGAKDTYVSLVVVAVVGIVANVFFAPLLLAWGAIIAGRRQAQPGHFILQNCPSYRIGG